MHRLSVLAAVVVFSILSLTVCAGIKADIGNPAADFNSSQQVDSNDSNDPNGPIVVLDYSGQAAQNNPFDSFMYFVPLVSLTDVNIEVSADNDQHVGTVSYDRKISSKSFYVDCVFEMTGNGFHKYIFDPAQVISLHAGGVEKGKTLEHLIDYIKFEGSGFGRVIVKGTVSGKTYTVDLLELQFNTRSHKSPVSIGIYDIPTVNGHYIYDNRINKLAARVNSFEFKNTPDNPRMGIKLSSISSAEKPDGLLAGLRGAIANLFINPPKIAPLGNNTMMQFGLAIFNQKPSFAFPKAGNIKKITQESKNNN